MRDCRRSRRENKKKKAGTAMAMEVRKKGEESGRGHDVVEKLKEGKKREYMEGEKRETREKDGKKK